MALEYRVIEIYTSEGSVSRGAPVYERVVEYVQGLNTSARCLVFKAVGGGYETGETASSKVLDLSYNMPLKIEIVVPAAESEQILADLDRIVVDGLLGVRGLTVLSNKTKGRLLSPRLLVRDLMTPDPVRVREDDSLDNILAALLSSTFTGVPVVDDQNRVVGVLSQTDMIYRAGMPLRLALMAGARDRIEEIKRGLSHRLAKDIMNSPPVCIDEKAPATRAVAAMIEKGVKRLPVTDDSGKLIGIVSRTDIFKAVTRASATAEKSREQSAVFENVRQVSDIMEPAPATVRPDEPVEEVIRLIHARGVIRVWVTDRDGRLLGMISDRNLLAAFHEEHPGIWELLCRVMPSRDKKACFRDFGAKLRRKTAGEIMKTDIVSAKEGAPVEEAIEIMTKKEFRRLPVVGEDGKLKGVVSRETLLRKGFEVV